MIYTAKQLTKGDYLRLIRGGKPTKKVYVVTAKLREGIVIADCEDINNFRTIKRETKVDVNFTY